MERRFAVFMMLSVAVLLGYAYLVNTFAPPPPPKPVAKKPDDAKSPDQPATPDKPAPDKPASPEVGPAPAFSGTPRIVAVGSYAPGGPFRLLAYFNSRGAGIERVELCERDKSGRLRYRDLDQPGGYLGYLAGTNEPGGKGCRVRVVGDGTPAALAKAESSADANGLAVDDVITAIADQPVKSAADLDRQLAGTKPGQTVKLRVQRNGTTRTFSATLDVRPLAVIQPEFDSPALPATQHPLTCQLTLESAGPHEAPRLTEIAGLPSLAQMPWETVSDPAQPDAVAFRYVVTSPANDVNLKIIKRFRLVRVPSNEQANLGFRGYHFAVELELKNLGTKPLSRVAYRLDGPTGLPLEGWWYLNKVHPRWSAAGARDIAWRVNGRGHELLGCSAIIADAIKNPSTPAKSLLGSGATVERRKIDYIGVDAQYFAAVLQPVLDPQAAPILCGDLQAMPAGDAVAQDKAADDKVRRKTFGVTFRLTSEPRTLPPEAAVKDRFWLFVGPKSPELLSRYELRPLIEYGWFPWVVKPLASILHLFYALVGNYAVAVVMLTVLVRGLMHPISRKANRNALMMQKLQPEMQKIREKYKNDMQKASLAQQELFRRYDYNPFGGCLLMFFQLPVFIGLYRCLSVDLELRQAPLWSGLRWCSNLAGPDALWRWDNYLPAFLAAESGWLGPYLNVLPIATIVLFLVQQKQIMPPAVDEQQRLQQKMMWWMTIFMGVMFYKVPAGLCIYFVASSLWGLVERKMMPKDLKLAEPAIVPANRPAPSRASFEDKVKKVMDYLNTKTESDTDDRNDRRDRRRKRRSKD